MKGLGIFFLLISSFLHAQVGINTVIPQEALHLGGENGTIRIESLNYVNNDYNGGDLNQDGNLSNDTFPLYVDENGDLSLKLEVFLNSQAQDALDDTTLNTNTIELQGNNNIGRDSTIIKSYVLVINRPTILEVKYNISHNIYLNSNLDTISDFLARRVSNYIIMSPDPDINDNITNRKYGPSTISYTSGSTNSIVGPFFNGHTVYIKIAQAGTYQLDIYGEVSSNLKWAGASGTQSRQTYVEFATDNDFLFFRLY